MDRPHLEVERALAKLINSGKKFTTADIFESAVDLPFPNNQLGNFVISWHSKGAIRRTGEMVPKKPNSKELRHVYEGVQVKDTIRYQVMPPLSPDEYQELYDSIRAEGVHDPIHVDENGVIIDGHHRSKIANELGIPCPVITHDNLDESGKRSLAFTLNLKRRHLSREQRNALVAESLRLDPLARDQDHARRTGTDPKTVKRIRADEGIPTPNEVIREYAEERPDMPNYRVAEELGVSEGTVKSVRDSQKRDIPEFEKKSKPTSMVGPNEEIPATTIIGTDDLNELNPPRPAEQPTPEPKEEEPITFTMRGTKAQKQQLKAAERLTIQLDSIGVALDHEFPVRVFDRTFTKENAAELAEALQRSARKLKIHATRLTEYAQGA